MIDEGCTCISIIIIYYIIKLLGFSLEDDATFALKQYIHSGRVIFEDWQRLYKNVELKRIISI